jgi:hypothetical protein
LKPLSPDLWRLLVLAMGAIGFGLAATVAMLAQA